MGLERRPIEERPAQPVQSSGSSFTRHLVAAVTLAAAAAVFIIAGRIILDVILLTFAGVLLGIFLQSLAGWTASRTGLGYGLSLALVVVVLAGLLAAGVFAGSGQIVQQSSQLADTLSETAQRVTEWLRQQGWGRWVLRQAESGSAGGGSAGEVASTVGTALWSASNFVVYLVVIVVLGLYLAAEPGPYRRGLLLLVPPGSRERASGIGREIYEILQWWLIGRVVSMLVIGVLTTAGLAILGVPLAVFLGLIAALLTFVPNVGPLISVVPAVVVASSGGATMILWVIALYAALQTLESYAVTPLIQRKAVSLPPGVILMSQVLLGLAAGWLGLAVATPLAATVVILVRELYVREERPPGRRA